MMREFSAYYSHFKVICGEMNSRVTSGRLSSRDVISYKVTVSSCELQPCRKRYAYYGEFLAFYSHFQVPSGQMTSLLGHFQSPEVM